MRLVMMGTGPFAVPTFETLLQSRHEVLALVTRPPRPVHGRRRQPVNPMREVAEAHGAPILMPESINSAEARDALSAPSPDLLVVCDYGQILASETLVVAPLGGINLHGSLLPKYRGAAPVQWAVYHGEAETGVTVIHMTPRLDAGPALAQQAVPIGPEETAAELEPRLAALGAPLVLEVVDALEAGTAQPQPQSRARATKAPRLKKSDGLVDWSRTAAEINNQVRALQPWPRTSTHVPQPGKAPLPLILHQVAVDPRPPDVPPGTVISTAPELLVATGSGCLQLVQLQPAGKRAMSAAEFLRGHPLEVGTRLG